MNKDSIMHARATFLLSDTGIRYFLLSGGVLLLLIKGFLAVKLNLYSDEIFYWLASTRPAIAYSDLPFVTALLVGLGTALDNSNSLTVRLPFILMGTSLPLIIYWLARPVTGARQALEAAALALCIPLGGFLGLLAVPDVPLLIFSLLCLGFFERALRTNRYRHWVATGLFAALGLCTHYRFILYPVAALLFLIAFEPARKQFLNPRLWLAAGLAACGLLPVLWFNLNNQLASASFYFIERHPWEFQASGLLHVFKQAFVVTPPLYALLLLTLWLLLQRDQRTQRSAALFGSFALVPLAVYLLFAPWTDANSTSLHWPLSGYFPLLVFAPMALRRTRRYLLSRWNLASTEKLLLAIPAIGFAGTLIALGGIGSQAYQAPLQKLVGTGLLSNKMAGWATFSTYTAELVDSEFEDLQPMVVTDNYYTAAQLLFAGVSDDVFTLDNDKAVRDGRLTQLQLWGLDASGIIRHTGRPVLYITEDSTLTVPDKQEVVGRMCGYVSNLEYVDELSLFNGDKRFSYYRGDALVSSAGEERKRAYPCPYPAWAWLEPPVAGAELSGIFHIEGWAYKEDIGIEAVHLLLDGEFVASMHYGAHRPDVVAVMDVRSDPNAPNLGYHYELDTRNMANGEYTIEIEVVDSTGVASRHGERTVTISN